MSRKCKIIICSLLIIGLTTFCLFQILSSPLKYRLKKNVIPDLYDITIRPYLLAKDGPKQFTFDGEVNITLHATESSTSVITLHKDDIDIIEGILYDENGKIIQKIALEDLVYKPRVDMFSVNTKAALEVNKSYVLYFKYVGKIRNGMAGVFRATYDDINWYAITHLQRINARTVFPCFDEPEFKAKFRMYISRPKPYSSFFNTRLISTTPDGADRVLDHFEETPPMSTYLVAFLISDFESRGDEDFKIIMHSKFHNKTNLAYEVGLKALEAYDKYTQLPYKTLGNTIMQKAGSTSFPHGGMENWGLCIYKDSVLALDPDYTDGWSDKENTITILVHEMAHMWFGNSVTFKWWSHFWLNEAFGRYYQYFMAHQIYPEYELDKQFVIKQVHSIFDTDATSSTQPLTSPEANINSPAEIDYKFSSISYVKGASIVRMIRNLMGAGNFDSAIRDYLRENHLKNTIPEDLFKHWRNHWPAEQNVDLKEFFYDWTEQEGFPVLLASTTENGEYSLKQQRFLLDKNDDATDYSYTTPITYTTNKEMNFDDLTPKFYFNKSQSEMLFGNAKEDEWIIFNLQQSNYYRVFYDKPLLSKLHKAFMAPNHSGIHVINRANAVDDLFASGLAGDMGYDEIFEFMEYLANEVEYLPWFAAFKRINIIHERLTLEEQKDFGAFLFKSLDKVYKKLGFENPKDTVLDVYNRNQVISWLCKYHHSHCNSEANNIFYEYKQNKTKPSPDFRETLYCSACREDKLDIYGYLSEMFMSESLTTEKEKLLRAMGCTIYYADIHYRFILSKEVPSDLKRIGLKSMYAQTSENVMPVFKLMTSDVEGLTKVLGSWGITAAVITDVTKYFTTQEQLDEFKQFITKKGSLFGYSLTTLEISVKTVEKNLEWATANLGNLFKYLHRGNKSEDVSGAASLKVAILLVPLLIIMSIKLYI